MRTWNDYKKHVKDIDNAGREERENIENMASIIGTIIDHRNALGISQRELADKMQLVGLDIDKNAIQRIECGKRFVTDIEVIAFAKVFRVTFEELLMTACQ